MHEMTGFIAAAISLAGSAVYIRSILTGRTRPHFYTHFIWALVTGIAFFAALSGHAGAGAWAVGATAAACMAQAILALKYGETDIRPLDRLCLATALAAILWWAVTRDPLLSVILAGVIDVVAFIPTFRKSWRKPWQENLAAYAIANVKLLLSLFALAHVSVVTAFYPVVGFSINAVFIALCLWRRGRVVTPAFA